MSQPQSLQPNKLPPNKSNEPSLHSLHVRPFTDGLHAHWPVFQLHVSNAPMVPSMKQSQSSQPSGLLIFKFQYDGLHSLQMRPATRSLHWHNSPAGTEPHPEKPDVIPAGSQLHSSHAG